MKNFFRELMSYIVIIIVTVAATQLFTHFVAQPLEVDGRSMHATLENGEKLWLLRLAKIDRFDVVVFPAPNGSGKLYVKRVIGLPGDTIEVKNDKLIINGKAMDEPYLKPMQHEFGGQFTEDYHLNGPVPEGKVLVMGDNRQNSLDGRSFGPIAIDDIQGEADGVFWPFSGLRTLTKYQLNADGSAIELR